MEQTLRDYEKKRDALVDSLKELGEFRRGTVTANYRKCGKPNCACADADFEQNCRLCTCEAFTKVDLPSYLEDRPKSGFICKPHNQKFGEENQNLHTVLEWDITLPEAEL